MDNLSEIKNLNKVEIINIFNDQIEIFINEMEKIINDLFNNNIIDSIIKEDITFYKNIANTSIKYTYNYIIESFGKYIIRNPNIVTAIMEKDLNIILNYEFEKDSSIEKYKEKYKNNLEIQDLIIIFKKSIAYLNEENKNNIFEYFQIFVQLTVTYMSKI
jgi:hypothetical protein